MLAIRYPFFQQKKKQKLTLLVAAGHRVAHVVGQIPMISQGEVVPRPLDGSDSVDDAAGQSDSAANDSRLVLRLHGKLLWLVLVLLQADTDINTKPQVPA